MNFFEIHKYPSRKNFPVYGNINRLYIDLESNKFYYWEDGKYFKISTVELDQATYDDIERKLQDIIRKNLPQDIDGGLWDGVDEGPWGSIDGGLW